MVPTTTLPAVVEAPRAPRGLSRQAQRVWANIWRYAGSWVTEGLDAAIVEQACRTYDEINRLRKLLVKHGDLIEEVHASASGKELGTRLVANPASKMLRDAEKAWTNYLVLLGIPPTERARLGLTQVKAQSKLEQLAAARAQRSQQQPAS